MKLSEGERKRHKCHLKIQWPMTSKMSLKKHKYLKKLNKLQVGHTQRAAHGDRLPSYCQKTENLESSKTEMTCHGQGFSIRLEPISHHQPLIVRRQWIAH